MIKNKEKEGKDKRLINSSKEKTQKREVNEDSEDEIEKNETNDLSNKSQKETTKINDYTDLFSNQTEFTNAPDEFYTLEISKTATRYALIYNNAALGGVCKSDTYYFLPHNNL